MGRTCLKIRECMRLPAFSFSCKNFRLPSAIIFSLCACIISCNEYPTDSSGRDLLEMESVWQYLKTYSFWQNNVPSDAFDFNTPEAMMTSIHDTLKRNEYTRYYYGFHSHATPEITVGWDSLTDSTALIQITQFSEDDSSTYFQFLDILPRVAHFSKIIIDLIGNPGGGIAVTDAIINAILPVSTPYIMETYRKYDYDLRTASTVPWDTVKTVTGRQPSLRNKRYAILFSKGSASAAEILIAAMKDGFSASKGDTAVLVGDTSYGKGIGQVRIDRYRKNKPDLLITFMRMKGISARIGDYFRKGIAPDTLVTDTDHLHIAQINAALKFLQPSVQIHDRRMLFKTMPAADRFRPEATIYSMEQ